VQAAPELRGGEGSDDEGQHGNCATRTLANLSVDEVCILHYAEHRRSRRNEVSPFPGDGGVRTSVAFLQESVVCERDRDPSRTTTPAGGQFVIMLVL